MIEIHSPPTASGQKTRIALQDAGPAYRIPWFDRPEGGPKRVAFRGLAA